MALDTSNSSLEPLHLTLGKLGSMQGRLSASGKGNTSVSSHEVNMADMAFKPIFFCSSMGKD